MFRKLLCHIFGHRSICLYRYLWKNSDTANGSEVTSWRCERCGYESTEQWDY
jgi:hypothetical protein